MSDNQATPNPIDIVTLEGSDRVECKPETIKISEMAQT